jgi:hypothetical protein
MKRSCLRRYRTFLWFCPIFRQKCWLFNFLWFFKPRQWWVFMTSPLNPSVGRNPNYRSEIIIYCILWVPLLWFTFTFVRRLLNKGRCWPRDSYWIAYFNYSRNIVFYSTVVYIVFYSTAIWRLLIKKLYAVWKSLNTSVIHSNWKFTISILRVVLVPFGPKKQTSSFILLSLHFLSPSEFRFLECV